MYANQDDIAKKLLDFNWKFVNWSDIFRKKIFNVNGKNGLELTIRQFYILAFINKQEDVTISMLGDVFSLSKSSLSITIDKLASLGYIEKVKAIKNDDKRKIYLELTDEGNTMIKVHEKLSSDLYNEFFNSLNNEDKDNLMKGIEYLSKIFDKQEDLK